MASRNPLWKFMYLLSNNYTSKLVIFRIPVEFADILFGIVVHSKYGNSAARVMLQTRVCRWSTTPQTRILWNMYKKNMYVHSGEQAADKVSRIFSIQKLMSCEYNFFFFGFVFNGLWHLTTVSWRSTLKYYYLDYLFLNFFFACHSHNTKHAHLERVWNVMAHAQKPDLVFQRNGRVHLKRRAFSSFDYGQPRCAHQR